MTQITEDYVSFEIAKLLKEKGFDGECDYWYGEYGEICCSPSVISVECWCPSQSLTLKWLREVHKIFVEPFVAIDLNGKYHYSFRLLNSICKDILEPKDLRNDFKDTYEEAIEVSLLYVLKNLI